MAQHTFSVKKERGAESQEFSIAAPTSTDSVEWESMISYSSPEDLQSKISDLALQSWTIKAQAAFRNSGTEPTDYVYGAKVTRARVVVEDAGFTPEQIEALKAKGIEIR